MKSRSLLATLGVSLLLAPAAADAHDTRSFWTQEKAERQLLVRYPDVIGTRCTGYGKRKEGPRFRHFRCVSDDPRGGRIVSILHVLSKRRFVVKMPD